MKNRIYQKIIEEYICAYNRMDVNGMLSNMHADIRFENISNAEITISLNGIEELRNQAKAAASAFKERKQRIVNLEFHQDHVEVIIAFHGILAMDLPGGLKAGERIDLEGRSIFNFRDDKIISLQDFS